ncbi:MAG TPA: NAD(P)H-quinone oxidoreductase [Propionibacteriaceae bacterium]|nr:NAD(P)H-quinone oxidoreductase [Propionibacteriaceae bacterium]
MRAITVEAPGGPDVMQFTDVPTPVPGPGEVLVRTVAAGVNRADLLQRTGHYPPPPGISDVIGLEASGVVEALSDDVDSWAVGDECVALLAGGGYAEYFVAPAGQLVRPPAGVDLVTAASLIEVAATVVSNMDHVGLKPGETLLVHGGSGGIGVFAIQYAVQLGCRVATTAGTAEKLAFCRDLGAEIALDYHDDWASQLKEATGGRGVDVILDIMGAKYLESNVASLALDGRMVTIGLQGGAKGTLNLGLLLSKRGTVTATSLRFRSLEQKAQICERVATLVWPMVEAGTLRPAPIKTFPLSDAAAAHEWLDSGANVGKIVLVA